MTASNDSSATSLAIARPADNHTLAENAGFRTALEPTSMDSAFAMANMMAKVGLCGCTSPESAMVKMLAGRELGLTTLQSMRSIHVIEGRPTLDASLMVALCLRAPQCDYFEMVESTDKVATYRAKRKGRPETTLTWTLDQAKKAGLVDRPTWKKFPEAMLRARCIAALARAVFPDILAALYVPDEIAANGSSLDDPMPANETVAHAEPAPLRVVPPPPPPSSVTELTMTDLRAKIDAIDSAESAKSVGAELAAAVKSGELPEANRALAKELLAAKYAEYVTKP